MTDELTGKVEEFYNGVSYIIPNTKPLSKKTHQPNKFFDLTAEKIYHAFKAESPGIKFSRSTFIKLRPKHVEKSATNKLRQCCCEYCTNMEPNIKIFYHVAQSKNLQNCKIRDKYRLSDIKLCVN